MSEKRSRPRTTGTGHPNTSTGTQHTAPIQPMPPLDTDQLDALRADIEANGVQMPVVKDQHGRILDGHNRAAIADQLGITYPVQTVHVTSDNDAWDRAVTLNCTRRHLTREQVRQVVANEIIRRPDDSDRAIARRVGCSPTTVGTVRAERRRDAEELTASDAEDLTASIRAWIDGLARACAEQALEWHTEKKYQWQQAGDVLERMTWSLLSKKDIEETVLDFSDPEIFGIVFGGCFDGIRAYDCDSDCEVCTPEQRQWRDDHPDQVYRWSDRVSNLDTAEAVTR